MPVSDRLTALVDEITAAFDPQQLLVYPFHGGVIIARRVPTSTEDREGRTVDLLPDGIHMDLYTDFKRESVTGSRVLQRADVDTAIAWLKSSRI